MLLKPSISLYILSLAPILDAYALAGPRSASTRRPPARVKSMFIDRKVDNFHVTSVQLYK